MISSRTKLCMMGQIDEAFQYLGRMCHQGRALSKDSVLQLLQRCSKRKELSLTRQAHALVVKGQLESIPILADHLIRMFAECGSLPEANLVFAKVNDPNVHTWNAIIATHAALGEPQMVFKIYDMMICEGTKPDKFIYMSVLKVCSNTKDLTQGKFIHNQILENRFSLDVIMGSTLVDMYAKCGNLDLACEVFDNMPSRDKVTWNAMIGAYVHNGNGASALELFRKMQVEGIDPDRVTYLSTLKACAIMGSLDQGKAIHEHISNGGLEVDVVIGSTLIDMYTKCGSMEEAHKVFDNLPNRNVVSWGAMIAGYTQLGHGLTALALFGKMQQEGVKPDKVILACLLKACGSIKSLGHGTMLHEQVIKNGLESDVFVGNNLFYMYAKSGNLEEARKVFDGLSNRDVISWATMIAGYAHNGQALPALELFKEMQLQGVSPDEVTYSCVLKACGSAGAFGEGKLIHDKFSKESESDVILANTLIDMYAKSGNVKAAHKLFNALPNRNAVSWNSIITAYAHDGQGSNVFKLFKEMQEEGIRPTKVTFLGILKACVNSVDLDYAKMIHGQLLNNGLASDITISNTLIDAYAKCGGLKLAREVFNNLPNPDAVSWGVMIGGYVHNGNNNAALNLFKRMQQEGIKPDNITIASVLKACSITGALEQGKLLHDYTKESRAILDVLVGNALVDMYAKCGSIEKARELFDDMPRHDVISWNTMISAYTLHGHASEALKLFEDMRRSGLKPDEITFLCILKACSNLAFIEQGRQIHDYIIKNKNGLSLAIGNTLLDMYVKCGSLREARSVFDKFGMRDIVSWGVIIGGYAQHGLLNLAKQCLQDMKRQGMKPDPPIHLSILAACRHKGLADEGYNYFRSMKKEYDALPTIEHFNILVDLLGRAGRLEEAEELLHTVPSLPTLPAWTSLLTACKAYGNKDLGRCCFHEVSQLDPNNASGNAMMSKIYDDTDMCSY